jgi:RNA polymerase sigma-70 factor (ECF subfamily)
MTEIDLYLQNYRKTFKKNWFEKIYLAYVSKIYSYFYYKLYDKHLAEDLTNEVFLKVYKAIGIKKFKSKDFKIWIYKVAKNNFIDYIRKNQKKGKEVNIEQLEDDIDIYYPEKDSFTKASSVLNKELGINNIRLLKAMEKLTLLQRDVLTLYFLEDFDYFTIARVYGKSQSTIRGIVMRALNALREEMIR